MPIPNGVTDQNSVNFGGGTLNPAQKFLSNLAFRTILEGVNAGGKEASKAFQKAVKVVYAIEDGKEIKPEMEYEEYEVGDKPEKFQFKKV